MNEPSLYTSGEYLEKNLMWHAEDSPWKAKQILKIMKRNNISPKTICEIGCGAGGILKNLQLAMKSNCKFYGYEISPHAFQLCQPKANENLLFLLKDITEEKNIFYDLILLIDVIEHLEDYYSFLRKIKPLSLFKIIHLPLDICVSNVIRKGSLLNKWHDVGHIHFFTKETALQLLKDIGYEIIDYFYTNSAELPAVTKKSLIAKLPRNLIFKINEDWAARIMGGCQFMLLVR
jgi:SAM-dependent methyltransferase